MRWLVGAVLGALAVVSAGAAAAAEATPIALGEAVDGAIAVSGESQVYTIDVPPGTRVLVDRTASSAPNALVWSLTDPVGRVVAASPTALNDLGPLALVGGTYSLAIAGEGDAAGTYSFVVHDSPATESTTALGGTVSGAFTTPGAVHRYTFDAPAGSRLFLDTLGATTASSVNLELLDPWGRALLPRTTSAGDSGPYPLAPGKHTLAVYAESDQLGTYEIQLVSVVDTAQSHAPLAVVDGALTHPGQRADHAFTLTAPTRLALDLLASSNGTGLNFELRTAGGAPVLPRTTALGDQGPWTLPAGDYVVTVVGEGSATGTYSYTFVESADVEATLDLDAVVAWDAPLGASHSFAFTAPPGAVVFIDHQGATNLSGFGYRLDDGLGRRILATTGSLGDQGPFRLAGGDYTLHILPEGAATGSGTFALRSVPEAPPQVASLGAPVSGAIDVPGEADVYLFTAPPGRVVTLDQTATSNIGGLNWLVRDALGRDVLPRTTNLNDQTLALLGGTYTLSVLSESGAVGTYAFTLVDAGPATAPAPGTPIALGEVISAAIDASGEVDTYTLDLAADTKVYLDLQLAASGLLWQLVDGAGQPVFPEASATSATSSDRGPFPLAAGSYTLSLRHSGTGTPSYQFSILTPEDQSGTFTLEEVAPGDVATPGATHTWTINLAEDARVFLDLQKGANQLFWTLIDPVGQPVFERTEAEATASTGDQGPFTLAAGTYTLIIDSSQGVTAPYTFQLRSTADLSAPAALPAELTATFPSAGGTYTVFFPATAGQVLYVDALATTGRVRWTLTDPLGRELVTAAIFDDGADDLGPFPLGAGTYSLRVDPDNDLVPTTTFNLLALPAPPVLTAALDTPVTGTFSTPGERVQVTLSLAQPTRTMFDLTVGAGSLVGTLTSPTGEVLFADRTLNNATGDDVGPWTLPAGLVRLELWSSGGGLPPWALRFPAVADLDGGAIAPNQVVNGAIPTAGAVATYTFSPDSPGQSLTFDVTKPTASMTASLYDPAGEPIFQNLAANSTAHDRGPWPLAAGTYTVVLDADDAATPPFQFRIKGESALPPIPDGCAACGALDVVFLFDTSSSMGAEAQLVCDLAADLIAGLEARGIPVTATLLGIGGTSVIPCAATTVNDLLGSDVPGDPPPGFESVLGCTQAGGDLENWALATAIVSERFPWQDGAVRLVMPFSDEGPFCGDPYDQEDEIAIDHAVAIAAANQVVVSPFVEPGLNDQLDILAGVLAGGTSGTAAFYTTDASTLLAAVNSVSQDACTAGSTEDVRPEVTGLEPASGSVLVAGQTVVLTGTVQTVNALRPVLAVLVDGVPVDALDAGGHFFTRLEVPSGTRELTLELVEECGAFASTITLTGTPDGADPFSTLSEVSLDMAVSYSDTGFDLGHSRLVVDALPVNVGGDTIVGPLLMAFGSQLPPAVTLANPAGLTPSGQPYVVALPAGQSLAPGASAPRVALAFDDPQRVPVRFDVHWLAPANRAPAFTSVPTVAARADLPWRYDADAADPDGHPVSFSLVTAPPAMTIDPASGLATWTPTAADVGAHDVRLAASDGHGATTSQRFTLTVTAAGPNAPPVFTSVPVTYAAVGAAYAYAAHATDADGDTLSYALTTAPPGMTVDASTGALTWSFALPGAHKVLLIVSDGVGGKASQTFTVGVGELPKNPGAPLISSVPTVLAAVGKVWLYVVVASDPDGDPLTTTLTTAPAGMTLTAGQDIARWVPTAADLGTHLVELSVSDGEGGVTTQTFAVTVVDALPSAPPVVATAPTLHAVVGQPWLYEVAAVDPDGGDVLYALAAGPAGMTLDPTTGAMSWTPTLADVGEVGVGIAISDADGGLSAQGFILTVRESNAAPVVTSTPPATTWAGAPYLYKAKATDADGDPLAWALVSGPPGMKVLASTGLVSWVPEASDAGEVSVTVAVSDGWGAVVEHAWTLTVLLDSQPPEVLVTTATDPACMNRPVRVCAAASDDVAVATRTLSADDVPLPLDANGCATLSRAEPVTVSFTATATDPSGNVGTAARALPFEDCTDLNKPVASVLSPEPGALLLGPVEIVGSITDDKPQNLTWTVSIARDGDSTWKVIASGSGEVNGGVLATLDTTLLPNDTYRIQILGDDGQNTGGVQFQYGVGGDYKLGNFQTVFVDLVLNVAGIPLSVTRIYDSLDTRVGDFGAGWRLQLAAEVSDSVTETAATGLAGLLGDEPMKAGARVVVSRPDGRRVGFTFEPTQLGFPTLFSARPAWTPDPGVKDTLEAVDVTTIFNYGGSFFNFVIPYNPDTYTLTTEDKVRYTVSETLGLTHVEDAQGHTLEVTEDGVVSSTGVELVYQRDTAGRITAIIEPDDPDDALPPGELRYAYDGAGNLATFTDQAAAVTQFFYEDADFPHYLTRVVDPLDRPLMRSFFDDDGRLIAVCGPEDDAVTLEGCDTIAHDVSGGVTTFVDARGFRRDLLYDERGNVVVERRWIDDLSFFDTVHVYDEDNNEVAVTDALGNTWTWTYDDQGRELSMTEPGGAAWTQTWDAKCDELASSCDPLGHCTRWTYDAKCHITSATDPLGAVSLMEHDAGGRLTARLDSLGNLWQATYDGRGLLQTRIDPRGNVETYTHDGLGQLVAITDRNGRTRTRSYDATHQLVKETWDTVPPTEITRTWTAAGQLASITSPSYAMTMTYHPSGRLARVDNAGSPGAPPVTVDYLWDGSGNVVEVADSAGGVTRYTWDGLGRLTSATQTGDGVDDKRVDQTWDGGGVQQDLRRYSDLGGAVGVAFTEFDYQCGGCPLRRTGLRHRRASDGATIDTIALVRDAALNVLQMTDSDGLHTYAVDGARRPLAADHPSGAQPDESYVWDSEGNRLADQGGASYVYAYQQQAGTGVQLMADATWTYAWDAAGNMVKRTAKAGGAFETFDYDYDNRLIAHTQHDAGGAVVKAWTFGYTPLGVRVRITEDGVDRFVIQDFDNPALVLDAAGAVLERRFYGRRFDEVWATETGGQTRWLLTDHLGSVRDVVGDDGAVLARMRYASFGRLVGGTGTPPSLLFSAREFETPAGLGQYRDRVYDPDTGRFLTEDAEPPFAYSYAQSAPTVFMDPTGRLAAIEYINLLCDVAGALSAAKGYAATAGALWNNVATAVINLEGSDGLAGVPPPLTPHSLLPCGFGEITSL
jgi:RHS repeat-associated protein